MPPPPKCSESRYVAPWSVLWLFLSESYPLGRACLETHLVENATEPHFAFSWMQSYNTTNFPARLFNNPLLTKCTLQSSLDGQGHQTEDWEASIHSLCPKLSASHAGPSARPSVASLIFHNSLSSLLGLVPHTPVPHQTDSRDPLENRPFVKKRPLLYLKLWGLAGVRPEFYSQILSVFGLLLVFLLAFWDKISYIPELSI